MGMGRGLLCSLRLCHLTTMNASVRFPATVHPVAVINI